MEHEGGPLSREKLRVLRSLDSMKIRRRKGLCVVEGERSLQESARTGNLVYLVMSEDRALDGKFTSRLLPRLDAPWYTLPGVHFRDLTELKTGTGLLGVARIPPRGDHRVLKDLPAGSRFFYLDGIQEPGNVGALIRTAWALGFTGVLLGEGTADTFSAKGVRASSGGVFHLPLYSGVGQGEMAELLSAGYSLFAAQKGGQDYRMVKYPQRCVLALGSEGAGFSGWVLEAAHVVGIPLAEGVDSLNVVVAGGIIAAEMMKDRE